ncbi:MAG: DUF5939 domain-containing protein, partial [Stellaceae bacterium]
MPGFYSLRGWPGIDDGKQGFPMSEAENLFKVLRQSADPGAVAAIEELVREAPDRRLCRINVLAFA